MFETVVRQDVQKYMQDHNCSSVTNGHQYIVIFFARGTVHTRHGRADFERSHGYQISFKPN